MPLVLKTTRNPKIFEIGIKNVVAARMLKKCYNNSNPERFATNNRLNEGSYDFRINSFRVL